MPSKNDLSGLKGEEKKILPEPIRSAEIAEPTRQRQAAPTLQKRIGRPKKSPSEKRNHKVSLSLTKAEGEKVRAKAGLAGEATYLYDILRKAGAFR